MYEAPYLRPLRTLAGLPPGTSARIRYIAFRGIREAFQDAGLGEGDVITLRGTSGAALLLEAPGRGTVSLDPRWARFIEVDPGVVAGLPGQPVAPIAPS